MKTQETFPTAQEYRDIARIANRGVALFAELGIKVDAGGLIMDIENVHRFHPLRLDDLQNADRSNFFHDIAGIYKNFNRVTKELENSFCPRYSVQL